MLKVVKIGGNIVDNPEKLERFIKDFSLVEGRKILIHGGGKIATSISKSLGIETKMIDGRRVTDKDTVDIVTMVYAGLINKTIVGKLNAAGCKAVGLSGADGNLILARKRPPVPVDYGFVGDPTEVNMRLAGTLLDDGYTLVIAPVTTDGNGMLLNTNADTVARAVAVAAAQTEKTELVYCFEKNGVLGDVRDENSVIPVIDRKLYAELSERGAISAGMLPKLDNAFDAVTGGVERVVICNAANILSHDCGGTVVTL